MIALLIELNHRENDMKKANINGNVIYLSKHAEERMAEREMRMDHIMQALKEGDSYIKPNGDKQIQWRLDNGASAVMIALQPHEDGEIIASAWYRGARDNLAR